MEAIRVIGRIDLAQQIHAALVAAGAEANLATAAPMAVIATTERDGTRIDVLANGFDLCPAIKKAAPDRPVVMITWDEPGSELSRMMAASAAKTARGPDAHIPWPATGHDILAACERAKEAARIRRPRFTVSRILIRLAALAVLLVVGWAVFDAGRGWAARVSGAASPHDASRWARACLYLVQVAVLAGSAHLSWGRAGASSHPRWLRAWAVFAGLFSVLGVIAVVVILVE